MCTEVGVGFGGQLASRVCASSARGLKRGILRTVRGAVRRGNNVKAIAKCCSTNLPVLSIDRLLLRGLGRDCTSLVRQAGNSLGGLFCKRGIDFLRPRHFHRVRNTKRNRVLATSKAPIFIHLCGRSAISTSNELL